MVYIYRPNDNSPRQAADQEQQDPSSGAPTTHPPTFGGADISRHLRVLHASCFNLHYSHYNNGVFKNTRTCNTNNAGYYNSGTQHHPAIGRARGARGRAGRGRRAAKGGSGRGGGQRGGRNSREGGAAAGRRAGQEGGLRSVAAQREQAGRGGPTGRSKRAGRKSSRPAQGNTKEGSAPGGSRHG